MKINMKTLLFIVLFLLSTVLSAESNRPWWQLGQAVDEATGISETLFSSREQRILRDFLQNQGYTDRDSRYDQYDDRYDDDRDERKEHKDKHHKDKHKDKKSLPPGLQKKLARGGELPPGWQKKVARGEVLDAELYAVSSDLPPGILEQIESVDGTSIRRVEDRVVRIMDATGLILDVLTGQ